MATLRQQVKKLNLDTTVRPSLSDLLLFWESMREPGRLARLVGFLLLLLAGIGIGFVGSARIQYAREFYPLTFSANFLEDIRTGTKVRYQAALVVGEVVAIETDGNRHLIHVKIKKDFFIPKIGSRVRLSTWGYFGGKFINIDILESARHGEPWPAHSVIPMEPIVNSSIVLQQIFDYLKKHETAESLLEKQLLEIRDLSQRLVNAPFVKPRIVRLWIQDITSRAQLALVGVREMGSTFYVMANKLNEYSEGITTYLQENIFKLRNATEKFLRMVTYESNTFSSRLLHEETEYEELLSYLKYARRKTAEFKKDPYRIFFE